MSLVSFVSLFLLTCGKNQKKKNMGSSVKQTHQTHQTHQWTQIAKEAHRRAYAAQH